MAKRKKKVRIKPRAPGITLMSSAAAPTTEGPDLSSFHRAASLVVVGTVFLGMGYQLFSLINDYAVNIFFSDQWDINDAVLFQRHSLWEMFAWQHGPHRQGAGALLAWLVEPWFRWNSRSESFLVGSIIFLAACLALLLKRKLYGHVSYSDVIIPLIFLNPIQSDTLVGSANLAHGPVPLLLLMLYCLAWTSRRVEVRYGLVLTINFLTIYTGFGVFLGVLTPVLLAIDYWVNLRGRQHGTLYFFASLLLSLAALVSFFTGYRLQASVDCFSFQLGPVMGYARFAALMFAPTVGAHGTTAWPTFAGAIVLMFLLIALAVSATGLFRKDGSAWNQRLVIATLTAYCLLFCANTAYGRFCLGFSFAQMSRYFIYLWLGLLGSYFFVLTLSPMILRRTILSIFCFSLLISVTFIGDQVRAEMAGISEVKMRWKNCYLAGGDIAKCNEFTQVYPWDPQQTRLQEKLDFLKKSRQNLFDGSR